MTLKLEIETWVAAVTRYDNNEFDDALIEFAKISDTSKILFNMGVIHATLGEHEKAVEIYQRALALDRYLAIANFQQGVSNFLLGDFEEALANFNQALDNMRNHYVIDYSQLGLLYKLYTCEIMFNRGLCKIYLQRKEIGMQDLSEASRMKVTIDHDVIDEAIRDEAEAYTVFSIPVGVIYRPNEAKVRNLKPKDYLGKARLVATIDEADAFIGFAGSQSKNAEKTDVKDNRPVYDMSFTATNAVNPSIQARLQQSEASSSRNVFPPTPPPDNDRLGRTSGSVRSASRPMAAKLTIQTPQPSRRYEKIPASEDTRTTKSATSSVSPEEFYRRDPSSAHRRAASCIQEAEEIGTGTVYDAYQGGGSIRRQSRDSRRPSLRLGAQHPIDGRSYGDGCSEVAEREIISNTHRRQGSRPEPCASSRRPEVRAVRVKVHAADIRYVMVGPDIEYPDFVDRIREKLGIRRRFKMKILDEDMPDGDMITVGDQDDLEMAIQSSTSLAKRQGQEIAKLEIWVFDL